MHEHLQPTNNESQPTPNDFPKTRHPEYYPTECDVLRPRVISFNAPNKIPIIETVL